MSDRMPILQLKRVFPVGLEHIIGTLYVRLDVRRYVTLLWMLCIQRFNLLYFGN